MPLTRREFTGRSALTGAGLVLTGATGAFATAPGALAAEDAPEVDPYDRRANRNPKPIKAFGRYDHEAVVIAPRTGYAYLTEDASKPNGLFYRWVPPHGFQYGRGQLRLLADDAGVLQALRCFDVGGRFVDDLSRAPKLGAVYGVDWVDVPEREAKTVDVREQFDGGATRARKLEGMWWADGGAYIVSSYARDESPGAPHDGQVWFYHPRRRTLTLKVLLGVNAEPDKDGGFDGPDNITVSPYGGLVIAEDGEGLQHLFGATERGRTYPIARNDLNDSEFTGVVFSPEAAFFSPISRSRASCWPSSARGGVLPGTDPDGSVPGPCPRPAGTGGKGRSVACVSRVGPAQFGGRDQKRASVSPSTATPSHG